jgi:DNA-binding transcriptional ArsR family regulator
VLASPGRLAIVDLLTTEPRYVHQLAELTGLTQPRVSQHLRVLRQAGVVRGIRRHREIAYALRDDHVPLIMRHALARGVPERPVAPGGDTAPTARAAPPAQGDRQCSS